MNKEDIIRMAREVHDGVVFMPEDLERFAALVAAHEREECAKVCDARLALTRQHGSEDIEARACAAAIRARSE
jgi:hypothetical protein